MNNRFSRNILDLPRPAKRLIALAVDFALCLLAVRLAFYLRLEVWSAMPRGQLVAAALSVSLALPIFIATGLYRAIFRYGGTRLLQGVLQASAIYALLYGFLITLWSIEDIPRSIGILQPVLLFLMVGLSRVIVSWLLGEGYALAIGEAARRPVAIYGAGAAGRQLCQGLEHSTMRMVAFIDDDPALRGRVLLGRPVFGPDEIGSVVTRLGLKDILLAIPSASRRRRNAILDRIRHHQVAVRTIPGVSELAAGTVKTEDFRELDIDDLLGRNLVEPDEALLRQAIAGKTVMVTGAGGSIGSELCRQIAARDPTKLLLIDNSEHALYAIDRELRILAQCGASEVEIIPLLGSVCDPSRMNAVISAWRPDTIYHAAAYKHVPLVEHNPSEGVTNNVFGTLSVAKAAIAAGVPKFVLVSTDKAVRPTNVMGATKRLAELVLQALAAEPAHCGTTISMVRFGNVLGSSGSVVPLFREQIRSGGPVTITHPDVVRYFMTIPEASQLVIQAGEMAAGGEVFVLDMGDPVSIRELAVRMVELSGLSVQDADHPAGDIAIEVVGLRPGEKLHEELLIGNDPTATSHPRIMMAREHFLRWEALSGRLERLAKAAKGGEASEAKTLLDELVAEYRPDPNEHDLVRRQIAVI